MSTKTFCDRCEREMTRGIDSLSDVIYIVCVTEVITSKDACREFEKDLCRTCQNEIYKFAFPKEGK